MVATFILGSLQVQAHIEQCRNPTPFDDFRPRLQINAEQQLQLDQQRIREGHRRAAGLHSFLRGGSRGFEDASILDEFWD